MSVRISARNTILLYLKQSGRCNYCGDVFELDSQPTVDHIIPKTDPKSTNDISNYCLACENCNTAKGDLSIEEFKKTKYFKNLDINKPCL